LLCWSSAGSLRWVSFLTSAPNRLVTGTGIAWSSLDEVQSLPAAVLVVFSFRHGDPRDHGNRRNAP
jgi:hypothetical protein